MPSGVKSLYEPGKPVGKACEQVGRLLSGDITGSDTDLYDKWSQALSSVHEPAHARYVSGSERTGDVAMSYVVSVVVVPDDGLWVATSTETGIGRRSLVQQIDVRIP